MNIYIFIIIAGKTGAIEGEGQVLFYESLILPPKVYSCATKRTPNDVTALSEPHRSFLVSDSGGSIMKFSSRGVLLSVIDNVFKGIGRLASDKQNLLYVTSSSEHCVYIFDHDMTKLSTVTALDQMVCPHYVAVNQFSDVIISDMDTNALLCFCDNKVKFSYKGTLHTNLEPEDTKSVGEVAPSDGNKLRCFSAVCCDSFDNILIADFMNDCIHYVSSSGEFLGYLLLRKDGISCPNFLTIDHEGQLIVGQYGGDINVYNYISYTKHV